MIRPFAAALVVGLALAAPTIDLAPSLVLDQSSPVFGQQVTFTGTYGKVYHGRQPQLPNQPQVQVNCTIDLDGSGWQDNQWTSNKLNLGNGWATSTYPFTLAGGGNGAHWTSGGASCGAVLFYFDPDFTLHELAWMGFQVAP